MVDNHYFIIFRIIIVYGEFTSLLVERTYGIGTSSPTLMLKWFGGGRILYRMQIDLISLRILLIGH